MQLHLTLLGEGPLRTRLYRDLRTALLDGRLQRGERLPPSRTLAGELGISRQLVVEAYERLIAEGFLVSRPGSGTFVERLPPGRESAVTPVGVRPGAHWPVRPLWGDMQARRYNFAGGGTERSQLPWQAWRHLTATVANIAAGVASGAVVLKCAKGCIWPPNRRFVSTPK